MMDVDKSGTYKPISQFAPEYPVGQLQVNAPSNGIVSLHTPMLRQPKRFGPYDDTEQSSQRCVMQVVVCTCALGHDTPPFALGCNTTMVRDIRPTPHDAHDDHADQEYSQSMAVVEDEQMNTYIGIRKKTDGMAVCYRQVSLEQAHHSCHSSL